MKFAARLATITIATLAINYLVVYCAYALHPWPPDIVQRLGSVPFYTLWIIVGLIYRLGWRELGIVRWHVWSASWSRRERLVIAVAAAIALAMYAPMVVKVIANGATPPRLDFFGGVVMAPFVEEWVFRALIWNTIDAVASDRRHGLVANLVVGSLVFGLYHLPFEGYSWLALANVVPHAAFGCVMGFLRWRTGSVLPGAVLHLVGNFVARLAMP